MQQRAPELTSITVGPSTPRKAFACEGGRVLAVHSMPLFQCRPPFDTGNAILGCLAMCVRVYSNNPADGKRVLCEHATQAGNKPNAAGAPKSNIQHNSQHTKGLCFLHPICGTLTAAKASREPQALKNTSPALTTTAGNVRHTTSAG